MTAAAAQTAAQALVSAASPAPQDSAVHIQPLSLGAKFWPRVVSR